MCLLADDRCCVWVKNAFFSAPDDLALQSLTVQSTEGYSGPLGENIPRSELRCHRKPASRTVTPLQFICYLPPPSPEGLMALGGSLKRASRLNVSTETPLLKLKLWAVMQREHADHQGPVSLASALMSQFWGS